MHAAPPPPAFFPSQMMMNRQNVAHDAVSPSSTAAATKASSGEVRITGWCWWTTVVTPPNMHVVHTRRGHAEPLHLGLGISFYYNRYTDSFLVAPSTLQTLLINARCICKERQGVLISAYVQYVIDDFSIAYRKLDFSDLEDPMRIVNIQLREQCEASIKDKVATLSIDEVLADKRPIVDELTARLRSVSDGQGLKIVQVQIKEAVVSSSTLWDSLQRPFREEQTRVAKLAELDRERVIRKREGEDQSETQRNQNEARFEMEKHRRMNEVELARANAELEGVRVAAELAQIEAQNKLDEARAMARLEALKRENAIRELEHEAQLKREYANLKLEEERKRVENLVTSTRLEEILIRSLPSIVEKMPKPDKSQVVHFSSDGKQAPDSLLALSGIMKVIKSATGSIASDKDSLM